MMQKSLISSYKTATRSGSIIMNEIKSLTSDISNPLIDPISKNTFVNHDIWSNDYTYKRDDIAV